jgi:hypothetical protein
MEIRMKDEALSPSQFPNDTVHIVWALGEFYLFILCVFLILTKLTNAS